MDESAMQESIAVSAGCREGAGYPEQHAQVGKGLQLLGHLLRHQAHEVGHQGLQAWPPCTAISNGAPCWLAFDALDEANSG